MSPRFLLTLALTIGAAGGLPAQDCDDPGIRVTQERRGNTIHLFAETAEYREATITLTADLTNMRSSRPLPATFELRGPERIELAVLQPAAEGQWSYNYRYRWLNGTRGGQPDDTTYRLPFAAGAGRRLVQGYRGKFSHQAGTNDEHALDWRMPEGTAVLAARGGIVAAVRQDSTRGGADPKFRNCGNYIVIRHADGTYGEYYHLQAHGARVQPGDSVTTGQLLGLSGNTGFSTFPHLHFAVFRTIDGNRRQSLPVKFQTDAGKSIAIAEGRTY